MRLRKNLWQFVVFGLAVALVLSIYADLESLRRALRTFKWWLIPVVLGLTLTNQLLRFLKWEYLLGKVEVNLPFSTSLHIFGSGLIMIMTPGKIGEVWKSWLVRDVEGSSVSTTMPVVATERLTDLLGVMTFALLGVVAFGYSPVVLIVMVVPIFIGIAILQNQAVCLHLLGYAEQVPLLRRRADELRNLYESSYELLQPLPLAVTTGLSILSWGMECIGLWVILWGFGTEVSMLVAAFVFAVSSLLGAISLIPGGLGVTDGSMTGLLLVFGVTRVTAVSSTLLVRAGTLWFSAGLALVVYAHFRRNQSRTFESQEDPE